MKQVKRKRARCQVSGRIVQPNFWSGPDCKVPIKRRWVPCHSGLGILCHTKCLWPLYTNLHRRQLLSRHTAPLRSNVDCDKDLNMPR